jgi:hypothetical protein
MKKEEIEHRIEIHETAIQCSKEIIEQLQAQLAESEPELRHGDYGNSPDVGRYIILKGVVYWLEDKAFSKNPPSRTVRSNICGNLADDLKALSEPIEEFEVDGFHVRLIGKKIIFGGKPLSFEDAEEMWKQTRRVTHTAKMQAGLKAKE